MDLRRRSRKVAECENYKTEDSFQARSVDCNVVVIIEISLNRLLVALDQYVLA
jgi:hypothetical protein